MHIACVPVASVRAKGTIGGDPMWREKGLGAAELARRKRG